MFKSIVVSSFVLAALSASSFAATSAASFYVARDAKSHLCSVVNAKPDGKTMMDAGNKSYASEANAKQALAALKACAAAPAAAAAPAPKPAAVVPAAKPATAAKPAAAAPAAATGSFYVEQDAKSHKCDVATAKPDGKKMIDVGTKVYETEGRAKQALSMLNVCK